MIYKTLKRTSLISLCQIVIMLALILPPRIAHASYNPNNLIDDIVFLNASAMNTTQIQSFLVDKGSYLASYSAPRWIDGVVVPASQIIYEAAQDYGLNPQVILATLQKEQSLVTNPSPSQAALDCAMGYYSCDWDNHPGARGFGPQVDFASWQLRHNYDTSSGIKPENYPCKNPSILYSSGILPGATVTFNNYSGVPYKTIIIANAATASLYCYTPHVGPFSETGYSGSYNFVISFEAWFGSTHRSLVGAFDGSGVYLIENDKKRPFPDGITFSSLGYKWADILFLSPTELSLIPDGTPVAYNAHYRDSRLITADGNAVYLVEYGAKRIFPSGAVFSSYSWARWVDIIPLSALEVSLIPDGSAIPYNVNYRNNRLITADGNAVYLVEYGAKRIFPSGAIFSSYSWAKWADIVPVSALELSLIPDGAAMFLNY
jgi:hypothetical protein